MQLCHSLTIQAHTILFYFSDLQLSLPVYRAAYCLLTFCRVTLQFELWDWMPTVV